jgi:uncharacterized protein
MPRQPRQSLFDDMAVEERRQKLQPNLFARLARFSFRNASIFLLFWCAVISAISYFALQNLTSKIQQPVTFNSTSIAAQHLQTLQSNFPHIDRLTTVTLTNQNSELMIEQRDALLENLKSQANMFDLVFAPGTGDYYDSHAILYLSKAEIEARAAYALSLRPLFSAIAQAPSADSLATLVGEVSASIKQGRDPQGLDELFVQSANSLQALMQGKNTPVNWIKIANLDVEKISTNALVLVVPKPGQDDLASVAVDKAVAQAVTDKSTTFTVQRAPTDDQPVVPKAPAENRIALLVAMAALLMIISTYSVLGRVCLLLSIALPVCVGAVVSLGAAVLLLPDKAVAIWPVYIAVSLISVVIAARYSFTLIEANISGRSPEVAAMLAAQKQGSGLVWQAAIGVFLWAGFFVYLNSPIKYIAVVGELGILAALMATLTFVPAMPKIFGSQFSWAARVWMEPLLHALFNTRVWRNLRTILTWVAIGLGCAGFYFAVVQIKFESRQKETNQIVNIVAPSLADAQNILLKLKAIPEAKSVRWLGAFLPQDIEDKQVVLTNLKEQFPRIGSLAALSVDDLRDQISTLQDSLREIAAEPATRPELRQAADAFRRSLALLSGTSTNVEIVEVENRLFGRFNALADRADQWASIEKPNLESLDKNLKKMFLSADNVYRIEVIPAAGQSNAALAKVLELKGLPVAHELLVDASQMNNALSSFEVILVSALAIGLIIVCFAIGEGAGIVSLIATSAVVFAMMAGAIGLLHVRLTAEILMIILANCTLLYCLIASAFLKAEITEEGMPDALHAIEAWLPSIIALSCAVPIYLLNINGAKRATLLVVGGSLIVTLTIGFLLRPICLFVRGGIE